MVSQVLAMIVVLAVMPIVIAGALLFLIFYNSIFAKMKREYRNLLKEIYKLQLRVDEANRDLQIVGLDVELWIRKARANEARVYEILEEKERVEKGCPNAKLCYTLYVNAKKTTQDIVELLRGGRFDRITYTPPPSSREHIISIAAENLLVQNQGDAPPPSSREHIIPIAAENLLVQNQGDETIEVASAPQMCRHFTFAEIRSATHNFNDAFVIGKGGFGKVYKGFVDNGATAVAIKRLDPMSNQGGTEFRTEINMLSKFRHCNLVTLIGYCDDGHEMILAYEYMLNGTLADHLHPKDGRNNHSSILSWVQRLKICIGAARGIEYLHTGTGVLRKVIHRDVKSSNILLDENWAAKVSDFGLCKIGPANQSCTHVSTCVKGTPGYCDPEYFLTHRLTKKSDVYSFGVVLFEVLSGKPALDFRLPKEQRSLVARAQQGVQENNIHQLIDPNLNWEICSNSLKAFVEIADQCLQSDPKKRPKMAEVVAKLEFALAAQTSKDSSLLAKDFFDFGGTYDEQERAGSPT
ncbi:hypothetical protein LguiA_004534 [Lonicera macranthoides]